MAASVLGTQAQQPTTGKKKLAKPSKQENPTLVPPPPTNAKLHIKPITGKAISNTKKVKTTTPVVKDGPSVQ